jgi:hypothetical protein
MNKLPLAVLSAAIMATPLAAHDLGFAGLLSNNNTEELAPITLSSGKPLAAEPYMLKSGTYYEIEIISDGTQELGLSGGDFFRAIWVDEIVINEIEIRPMGVHSLEFDDEGTVEMTFIAIVPGTYELRIPGSTGDSQKAVFVIQ